jgi:hypothetical protein
MRRVVTAVALAAATVILAACVGGATSDSTVGAPLPLSPVPSPVATGTTVATDVLSPTQPVTPGEMFPADPATVPKAVLADLAAKRPMLVYFYDPSTNVAGDQRREIDAVLRRYAGAIELVTFNYTSGLRSSDGSAATSLPPEVDKAELMTGQLKVNTTPYIVFVDGHGRITYRFAGFVDRALLEREVLRATE